MFSIKNLYNIYEKKVSDILNSKRDKFFEFLLKFAKLHDEFNNNIILKFTLFLIISFLSSIIFLLFSHNENEYINILKMGFLLAPLILLMINNQKYIIENFINTFKIDFNNKEEIVLDPKSLEIRENVLQVTVAISTLNTENKDYVSQWQSFEKIVKNAVKSRANFERLNNQSLLIMAFILLIGYIFLLFNVICVSVFLLFFSFYILINRVLIMGIRSILKYYCIAKQADELVIKIKELEKSKYPDSNL